MQLTRKKNLGLYQQTLLGPFWVLLQPLLALVCFVFCVIGISTGACHPFYLTLLALHCGVFFRKYFCRPQSIFKMLTFSIKYIFQEL
jgi:lipopolysaccharide transport system permease protein